MIYRMSRIEVPRDRVEDTAIPARVGERINVKISTELIPVTSWWQSLHRCTGTKCLTGHLLQPILILPAERIVRHAVGENWTIAKAPRLF